MLEEKPDRARAGDLPLSAIVTKVAGLLRTRRTTTPKPPAAPIEVTPGLNGSLGVMDLPDIAQAVALGATHIHPSWRSFEAIPLQPVPPDRYEIGFTDVPVSTRVSFRINDQNSCDENPTGAVTRNIVAALGDHPVRCPFSAHVFSAQRPR